LERERIEAEEKRKKLELEAMEKRELEELERKRALERNAAEAKRREQEELERIAAENRRLELEREQEELRRREESRLKLEELRRQRELEMQERKKKADEEAERLRLEIEKMNIEGLNNQRSSRLRLSLIPVQGIQLETNVLDLNKGKIDLTKELEEAENLRRMTQTIMRKQGDGRRQTVAERDEQLLKQRELLLAKKKAEREQQMKEFKESGGIDYSEDTDPAKDTGFSRPRNSLLDARRITAKGRNN
jgi:hypothetical protein